MWDTADARTVCLTRKTELQLQRLLAGADEKKTVASRDTMGGCFSNFWVRGNEFLKSGGAKVGSSHKPREFIMAAA